MKQIAFLLICFLFAFPAYSQNASNPVQVTSNLIPPYSLYLSNYSDASQNKWNIQLLLKDFTQTNYQAKLRITIEGAGIRLRTRKGYSAGPIRLDPGLPYQVDATDLSQYLNIQNMEVSGINRNQLASTQKLPEGFYHFKIEVLDYNRNNRVSNTGTSMAWLVLNDPPLLNLPFEEKLRIRDPQQVQFQWTPRHTSSPNSAFETEYIFRLWEIWPEGRDPNEVARTTQPLFERTIMTTSYFYGLNDAMLIPGRSYAWQVKAINLNGRDLFKNQGRSEVRWFKYGDECLPITNLGAEALGTDRIRITWEGKWNHNQYVAQIREKGEEGWINYGTNIETQVVYDLKASTEYQIRVLPSCGAIEGTAENTLTLVTLEQEPNDMNCGAEPDLPTIENREPIAQLSPGDRITAAGFTVILTEVIKTGNTYTGMGLIEVPLFNSARVEAVLNNIKVNTDKQLIGGTVESTLNPNGPFILDTDIDEELSEEGGNGEENNDDEEEIDDLPDTDIEIGGEIADVEYDEEEGTITVIDTEGNTTDIDPETADENGDGNVVIEDGKGNVWVVDDGGEVSGPHQSNPDTITEDTPIDFMVRFKESKNQQYGFDFKQHEALSSEYEQIQINGENYSIPWKSIKIGSTDPVTAEIIGKPEFPEMIGFRNFSSNLASSPTESQKEKTVTLQITTEEEEITAYVLQESTNEEGETEEESIAVGKLKVKQYEQIRKKIVLVQVNDADIPAPSLLQDELNGIYGPAVVEWDVSATEPYEVSEEQLETLDEGESGMFASFPQNMRQFNRKFKRSIDFDRDAYYLFVIEGNYSGKAGIMPFKRQFGYIFKDNVDNINKTLAHELAHGAFRLRHTFSEEGFIANMNSTDNLMDYRPDGTDLYKHQWDLVHDPESMIGWFEDDEESASGSTIYNSNGILTVNNNSKTLLKPNDIQLNYSIEDQNWNTFTSDISGSSEIDGYNVILLIQYEDIIVYDYTKTLESNGSIKWHGMVYNGEVPISSENKSKFKLHLGIVPKEENERSVKHWKVSLGSRPASTVIQSENGDDQLVFVDLQQSVPFEVNKAWENWESVDEETRSIVANFTTYQSFENVIREQSDGIGEIFSNVDNPLQYMFDQTDTVEFLETTIRVHREFKKKLEAIEQELGSSLVGVYSSKYKNSIGGIRLRKIQSSTTISNHSYGLSVDIYPKGNIYLINSAYNEYKGDMEVVAFINHVTGLDIMNMNDVSLIVEKNQMFVNKFNDYEFSDLVYAANQFKLYESNSDNFPVLSLMETSPFSEFDVLLADMEMGNVNSIRDYLLRLKRLHELLYDDYPILEFFVYSDLGRSQLYELREKVGSLYSDLSTLERDYSLENIQDVYSWIKNNQYNINDIEGMIEEINNFQNEIISLGYSDFLTYFANLIHWQENRFDNKLLQDGFCDMPLTLINSFLNQQDISWGGTWKGGRVDYMHFEIPKALVSDYLTE